MLNNCVRFLYILLILVPSEVSAFKIEVTASDYSPIVGDSVEFDCVPFEGVSPYKYKWNFDDIGQLYDSFIVQMQYICLVVRVGIL